MDQLHIITTTTNKTLIINRLTIMVREVVIVDAEAGVAVVEDEVEVVAGEAEEVDKVQLFTKFRMPLHLWPLQMVLRRLIREQMQIIIMLGNRKTHRGS